MAQPFAPPGIPSGTQPYPYPPQLLQRQRDGTVIHSIPAALATGHPPSQVSSDTHQSVQGIPTPAGSNSGGIAGAGSGGVGAAGAVAIPRSVGAGMMGAGPVGSNEQRVISGQPGAGGVHPMGAAVHANPHTQAMLQAQGHAMNPAFNKVSSVSDVKAHSDASLGPLATKIKGDYLKLCVPLLDTGVAVHRRLNDQAQASQVTMVDHAEIDSIQHHPAVHEDDCIIAGMQETENAQPCPGMKSVELQRTPTTDQLDHAFLQVSLQAPAYRQNSEGWRAQMSLECISTTTGEYNPSRLASWTALICVSGDNATKGQMEWDATSPPQYHSRVTTERLEFDSPLTPLRLGTPTVFAAGLHAIP
ncbi:hypothetical protein KEM56_007046 [Ascosphaera pollenicola]|nr:hypothetical protein KEM56_007046 [Ascosphaera pollenicola]